VKRITLRERGRLFRLRPDAEPPEGGLDAQWLDARLFDRLREYDFRRRDGAVFAWRHEDASAGQWVGVIQLPGLVVELLPKIEGDGDSQEDAVSLARDNLLAMLAESGDVPLRARDLASLSTRKAPLHEALVALFARRLLAELLRGPDRSYVHESDDLRTIRGKLLVGRHVSRNAARRERFTCAFEEYSIDTALSRVLLATCRALLGMASADTTREALSHCVLVLQDVGDVGDPLPWLDRVVLTRQNERFAELLVFCRMVLQQLAPTARAGRASTFSLLFDMDRVFEGFIAGFLRRRVLPDLPDTRVLPQARGRRDYLLRAEDGLDALRLKPDLLVEAPTARLVIDTKWKRLGGKSHERSGGVSSGDLYQLAAYTRRFGVARSVLLYPRTSGATERAFQLLDKHGQPEGAEVRVRFVDLHRNLRHTDGREALAAELRALLVDNLVAA
jgi:5-methylcytosine-specific restriction enzyme subunit McrC